MTVPGNNPAQSLHEENRMARQLLEVLNKEQAQLIAAGVDSLDMLSEEKNKLVERMSELAAQRYRALAANGFQAQEEGMRAWLGSIDSATTSQSWQELLETARAARDINRNNGMLINKHLARTQSALSVLRGGAPGDSLYGRNGQSAVSPGGRGLAIG